MTAPQIEPATPIETLRLRQPEDPLSTLLNGRRLITVSNREPYVRKRSADGTERYEARAGGLVTALTPVMRRSGGVWVAWDEQGERRRVQVPDRGPKFTLRQVPLTTSEVRQYYHGFANRALWPLCHYFVGRCHFDEAEWNAYMRVNQRFAEAVVEEASERDIVWVHDYHFCLAPRMIRERQRAGGPIAYFLHIPFPAEAVFRVLPWRREILEGLLGSDVVGFHTQDYAKNFLECCASILGADVDVPAGRLRWEGRQVRVGVYPIGIEFSEFEDIAKKPEVEATVARIRANLGAEKVVLGVDRLDYTKGILERLNGIGRLFERHPQYRGKVTFVQIAVPSRTNVKEYHELKRLVDETIGRINGQFSHSGWAPIVYIYRGLERHDVVAYYRAADVALITPLRDGMNLVAKEYAASRVDDDGVLVLSELAGAGRDLGEGAVLVNPYSLEDVTCALDWALTMDREERRRRMRLLREQVQQTDIHAWLASILSDVLGSEQGLLGDVAVHPGALIP